MLLRDLIGTNIPLGYLSIQPERLDPSGMSLGGNTFCRAG
jgi:hypothetical protein